jgi:hypothetical protein
MEHLDRSKPFGTINPPWRPAQADREAFYQQGEGLYDMGGRLIVPGEPLDHAAVEAEEALAREEAKEAAAALDEAVAEALAQKEIEASGRAREKAAAVRQRAQASVSVITPPHQPPELDRPAHYQIGKKFLDEHGREIVPGMPLSGDALAKAQAEEADIEGVTINELIAKANTLPLNVLLAAARTVLGRTCPKGPSQLVAQLRLLARRQPNLRIPRIRAAAT